VVGRYNYRYAVNAFIKLDESIHGVPVVIPTNHREIPGSKLDESIHGVPVVIPTNHREIPGSTPGRYNLQIEITSFVVNKGTISSCWSLFDSELVLCAR